MPKAAAVRQLHRPALKVGKIFLHQRRHVENERQGHDVEIEFALIRRLAQELDLGRVGRAFLTGGHARACVNLLRLMESVEQFLFTGLGHIGEDRQEGRLHDEAFRLLRSLLAQDQPARRGLGRGADADLLEGGRVQHRAMIGAVDQHHRIVGEMRIDIIARDLAPSDRLVMS